LSTTAITEKASTVSRLQQIVWVDGLRDRKE